jgi:uncharacterized membrane protein YcaP (DUF421 family)
MSVDFGQLFGLDVPVLELVIRSSVIYLVLLAALRIFGRREMGGRDPQDLLVLVVIADGVQNGMAGDYMSITGGIVVALTIFGWTYLLDFLAYHSKFVRTLLEPPPLLLIQNGRIIRRNMRRELISTDELQSYLRTQGIEDVREVREANLEPNGDLSVKRRDGNGGQ